MNLETIQTLPLRLWRWLKDQNQVVKDVPDAIACCEFDCSKPKCSEEEWETCERRIQYAADEAAHRAEHR